MNFDTKVSTWNMPELDWRYGYPFALAIMAAVAGVMLRYFKRHGWILRGRGTRDSQHDARPPASETQPL
jgi:magnesium transporter